MTPEEIAALVEVAWPNAGWSLPELRRTLDSPTARLFTRNRCAFLIAQIIPPEAEILIVAVDPDHRRNGHARALLDTLKTHAGQIFLDVRADNRPARALYHAAGFAQTGLRSGYYAAPNGARVDAVTMSWATAASGPV